MNARHRADNEQKKYKWTAGQVILLHMQTILANLALHVMDSFLLFGR